MRDSDRPLKSPRCCRHPLIGLYSWHANVVGVNQDSCQSLLIEMNNVLFYLSIGSC